MKCLKSWLVAMACVALSAHSASAATLLFDFGYAGSISASNNYNDVVIDQGGVPAVITPQPILIPNVIDSTGANTGASLSVSGFFPGGNPNGTTTPGGAAGANFVSTATQDNMFTHVGPFGGQTTNPKGTIVLSGLNDSTAYSFIFFASRMGVGDIRETKYTVTGSSSNSAFLNAAGNTSNVASVTGIYPNAGSISIDVEAGPNNNNGATKFSYIGAMRVDYTLVPEPAALGLVGLASLMLAFRRRLV